MKLQGLGKYKNINDLILSKIHSFGENPTEFSTLFKLMFSEEENVIAERLSGYKIEEITYGESKKNALNLGAELEELLSSFPKNSYIGLNMANSLRWIETFWGILLAGYKPLLINSRLPKITLDEMIEKYGVKAVISDGAEFPCKTFQEGDIRPKDCHREVDSFNFGTEIIFTSSGTQGEIKLCVYTAERFYYQICDTYHIVKNCPQIRKGYKGKIKQLALLPFYHVFGFMAVYLWFGFFSRTFVFLKDLSAQTLLNTVRRHKVTHIFAVPLVWETVYKSAIATIQSKGEKVVNRFNKGLKLAKKGTIGRLLTKKPFGEIRDQIFGDSVQFMISGGSCISQKAVEFLNCIGYHVANGYGMTEIGITSVELSLNAKKRNTLSVGKPFMHAKYKIENGELFVKSNTRATKITFKGQETVTDFEQWFATGDLAEERDGGFYITGRKDDLIVGETGENINPEIVEKFFYVKGVNEVCLFRTKEGVSTLLLSCPKVFSQQAVTDVKAAIDGVIHENSLASEIRKIAFTSSPLIEGNDFKVSRKKVAKKFEQNEFDLITLESFSDCEESDLTKIIRRVFAKVLEKEESDIGVNENFFTSLGGNSLNYFTLITLLKEELEVIIPVDEPQTLSSVKSIEEYILRRKV